MAQKGTYFSPLPLVGEGFSSFTPLSHKWERGRGRGQALAAHTNHIQTHYAPPSPPTPLPPSGRGEQYSLR